MSTKYVCTVFYNIYLCMRVYECVHDKTTKMQNVLKNSR